MTKTEAKVTAHWLDGPLINCASFEPTLVVGGDSRQEAA